MIREKTEFKGWIPWDSGIRPEVGTEVIFAFRLNDNNDWGTRNLMYIESRADEGICRKFIKNILNLGLELWWAYPPLPPKGGKYVKANLESK